MEWLPDDKYNKGKFFLQGAIGDILKPLRMYGQGEYVDQAVKEIVKVAEDWGKYIRGDFNKPINIKYIRRIK